MPRDLMHRGPRPFGPRAALEFDEVILCRELDDEERDAEKEDEPPKEQPVATYEDDKLPEFQNPNT